MKNKKILFALSLVVLLPIMSGCGESDKDDQEPQEKFPEYYDYNWTPGPDSLTANQPTIKNPQGEFSTLNELRRSQNRVGLPSSGEANILVVPLNFYEDDKIQEAVGSAFDLTIDEEDIEELNDMYFAKDTKYQYPSVSSYYKTSSFSKLNLSGVVSPLVSLPKTFSDYILKVAATSLKDAHNEILDYVYNYLFVETKTYYIGDFDSDNDGNVDAISLICNYPYGIQYTDDSITNIHQALTGPDNVYFKDTIASNTKVNSFSFISDVFRKGLYKDHDPRMYISLVGEMLGLDNYKDLTGNSTTGTYRAPLGYLDPMSGSLGDHNSFSKYQLGWIKPKFIKSEDIPEEGLEITLNGSTINGDSIILSSDEQSLFGEYLMIDLYTPRGVNRLDSKNTSTYGFSLFSQAGVRVYQVDSRLVRSDTSLYLPYQGEPNFDEELILPNGKKTSYIYDYAYTNNSVNEYAKNGFKNYALVSLLSKKGSNRHMTYHGSELSVDDLFLSGDKFGSDDQVEGFYKDYSFHGNGNFEKKLNISFEVVEIKNNIAKILLRREK